MSEPNGFVMQQLPLWVPLTPRAVYTKCQPTDEGDLDKFDETGYARYCPISSRDCHGTVTVKIPEGPFYFSGKEFLLTPDNTISPELPYPKSNELLQHMIDNEYPNTFVYAISEFPSKFRPGGFYFLHLTHFHSERMICSYCSRKIPDQSYVVTYPCGKFNHDNEMVWRIFHENCWPIFKVSECSKDVLVVDF